MKDEAAFHSEAMKLGLIGTPSSPRDARQFLNLAVRLLGRAQGAKLDFDTGTCRVLLTREDADDLFDLIAHLRKAV